MRSQDKLNTASHLCFQLLVFVMSHSVDRLICARAVANIAYDNVSKLVTLVINASSLHKREFLL